jgi:hypothetical protein
MLNITFPFRAVSVLLAACSILLFPGTVLADGMFIAPPGSFMYEPAQQAILEWDAEEQQETLTILPSFYGDARSFAWLVPTPTLPTVEAASSQLFWEIDQVTATVRRHRDGEWNCWGENRDYLVGADQTNEGVNIINESLVGYYRTLILHADDAQVLQDSLITWGFLHEQNQEEVVASLAHYVDQSWYFVAMQVDSTALDDYWYSGPYKDGLAETGKSQAPVYFPYWGLEPVQFSFTSEEPIYPMRISAYSAPQNTLVNIYTLADQRLDFPGARTYYANRFTGDEITQLGNYPRLTARLTTGTFLTKLSRNFLASEMEEDLVLNAAASQDEFRGVYYSGFPLTSLLLLGSPVIWFSYRLRRRRSGPAA